MSRSEHTLAHTSYSNKKWQKSNRKRKKSRRMSEKLIHLTNSSLKHREWWEMGPNGNQWLILDDNAHTHTILSYLIEGKNRQNKKRCQKRRTEEKEMLYNRKQKLMLAHWWNRWQGAKIQHWISCSKRRKDDMVYKRRATKSIRTAARKWKRERKSKLREIGYRSGI